MNKYRVYFTEVTKKYYYVDIEAEEAASAVKKVESGRYITLPIHKDELAEDYTDIEVEEFELID